MEAKKVFVRSAYNYDRNAASRAVAVESNAVEDPTPTIQSAKDDSDINVIVKRFGVAGPFPAGARLPTYGDFTQVDDFASAMQAVRKAEEEFMALPALLRQKFGNDPQRFLEFCTDPDNIEELREMGLAKPAPEVDNPPAETVDVPPSKTSEESYDDNRGYVEPGPAVSKPAAKPAAANAVRDYRKPELRGGK